MNGVQSALLSGDRLHLQHGPIDLVIGCDAQKERAFAAAKARLSTILAEVMDDIELLRRANGPAPKGRVALKMWHAAQGQLGFVTPMAGVAGSVAETVLEAMLQAAPSMKRAYVNNGGDIALHLAGTAEYSVAMSGLSGQRLGKLTLNAHHDVRGIATSGQGGRSLSFGIADSVTVLAATASQADVAATLIAGAVNLPDHPAIERRKACEIDDTSDLGARRVVTHVGALTEAEVSAALDAGQGLAHKMLRLGLIHAASLHLRGQSKQIEMNTKKVLEHA